MEWESWLLIRYGRSIVTAISGCLTFNASFRHCNWSSGRFFMSPMGSINSRRPWADQVGCAEQWLKRYLASRIALGTAEQRRYRLSWITHPRLTLSQTKEAEIPQKFRNSLVIGDGISNLWLCHSDSTCWHFILPISTRRHPFTSQSRGQTRPVSPGGFLGVPHAIIQFKP